MVIALGIGEGWWKFLNLWQRIDLYILLLERWKMVVAVPIAKRGNSWKLERW